MIFTYKDKLLDVARFIGDSEDFLSKYPFESNPCGDVRKDAVQLNDWRDAYVNYKENCEEYDQKDDELI